MSISFRIRTTWKSSACWKENKAFPFCVFLFKAKTLISGFLMFFPAWLFKAFNEYPGLWRLIVFFITYIQKNEVLYGKEREEAGLVKIKQGVVDFEGKGY